MEIKDKLVKVNNTFEVTKYDNGYLFAVRGEGHDGDSWTDCNIMVTSSADLNSLMIEWDLMENT
jgi:hypothetical protein